MRWEKNNYCMGEHSRLKITKNGVTATVWDLSYCVALTCINRIYMPSEWGYTIYQLLADGEQHTVIILFWGILSLSHILLRSSTFRIGHDGKWTASTKDGQEEKNLKNDHDVLDDGDPEGVFVQATMAEGMAG